MSDDVGEPSGLPEWTLTWAELVALGHWASSHVGHSDADAWWDSLDVAAQSAVVEAGTAAVNARNRDPGLAQVLAVRRNAALVLIVDPADGIQAIAHLDDAGRVVLERGDDERVRLMATGQDQAMALLAAVLEQGAGGIVQAVRLDTPGGREAGIYPDGDGQWIWLSADERLAVERSALPAALALLATAASIAVTAAAPD